MNRTLARTLRDYLFRLIEPSGFLERLANLDVEDAKKVQVFTARFHEFLPMGMEEDLACAERLERAGGKQGTVQRLRADIRKAWLWARAEVREAWREPVPLLKEATLMVSTGLYLTRYAAEAIEVAAAETYRLREEFAQALESGEPLGPVDFDDLIVPRGPAELAEAHEKAQAAGRKLRPDKFIVALLYALKHVHLLRYCANPDCKEPYFIARRSSQVFCSGPCAAPAQQEAKNKWWREHGETWRRKLSKRKSKRGGVQRQAKHRREASQ